MNALQAMTITLENAFHAAKEVRRTHWFAGREAIEAFCVSSLVAKGPRPPQDRRRPPGLTFRFKR